jgi:hypothetical protein
VSYHRLPTAPLASRHKGAGGGAVDNQAPQSSTYIRLISVQFTGATSVVLGAVIHGCANLSCGASETQEGAEIYLCEKMRIKDKIFEWLRV